MTDAEAIEQARSMIMCARPRYRDDEANEWARRIELYVKLDETADGESRDNVEFDWSVNVERIPSLIEATRSDRAAYDIATRLICNYLRWQRPLPESLAQYAISRLTGAEKKPHRKRKSNQPRDEISTVVIKWLAKNSTISPDRNEATPEKVTGISIVTQALREASFTATEAAIRTAFYRYRNSV